MTDTASLLRKMPINDVTVVLMSRNLPTDDAAALLIVRYHSGMTLTEAGKLKGVSVHRASDLVRKFLRRCRYPSNWVKLSEQSRNLLRPQ